MTDDTDMTRAEFYDAMAHGVPVRIVTSREEYERAAVWWVRRNSSGSPGVAHLISSQWIIRIEANLFVNPPEDSAHQGSDSPLISAGCGALIHPSVVQVAPISGDLPEGWVPCLICAREVDAESELS